MVELLSSMGGAFNKIKESANCRAKALVSNDHKSRDISVKTSWVFYQYSGADKLDHNSLAATTNYRMINP